MNPAVAARLRPSAEASVGAFRVAAHHGELLQGVFEDAGGLVPALVTLPCPALTTRATFDPGRPTDSLVVDPPDRPKARRAAELVLRRLRAMGVSTARGGTLRLESAIPQRFGFGSSTSDVVAAIGAAAAAHDVTLRREDVAALAVEAEVASDPLMFEAPVLFAQRGGYVVERLGERFPSLVVFGLDTSRGRSGVDTLALRLPSYRPPEVDRLAELRLQLRRALRSADLELLGEVATASARLNQRFLHNPWLDWLCRRADDLGALGLQVSHSGVVAGLLFDPLDARLESKLALAAKAMRARGFRWWTYEVGARDCAPLAFPGER